MPTTKKKTVSRRTSTATKKKTKTSSKRSKPATRTRTIVREIVRVVPSHEHQQPQQPQQPQQHQQPQYQSYARNYLNPWTGYYGGLHALIGVGQGLHLYNKPRSEPGDRIMTARPGRWNSNVGVNAVGPAPNAPAGVNTGTGMPRGGI